MYAIWFLSWSKISWNSWREWCGNGWSEGLWVLPQCTVTGIMVFQILAFALTSVYSQNTSKIPQIYTKIIVQGFSVFPMHVCCNKWLPDPERNAGLNVTSPAQDVPPGWSRPCGGWGAHSPSGIPSPPTRRTAQGLHDPEEAEVKG